MGPLQSPLLDSLAGQRARAIEVLFQLLDGFLAERENDLRAREHAPDRNPGAGTAHRPVCLQQQPARLTTRHHELTFRSQTSHWPSGPGPPWTAAVDFHLLNLSSL